MASLRDSPAARVTFRVFSSICVLAGSIAGARAWAMGTPKLELLGRYRRAVFFTPALIALLLTVLALGMVRQQQEPLVGWRKWLPRWELGAALAWAPALVMCRLYFVPVKTEHVPAWLAWAAISALVVAWELARSRDRRIPDLFLRELASAPRAWDLALLSITLGFCAWYVAIGAKLNQALDNDSAYYFGIARHIVQTGRFEDPLVWQFLTPPVSVTHPPFDYWQGLTSLLLLAPMKLLSPTHEVAGATMALVSSGTLLLFWYLLTRTGLVRQPAMQLLALVLFALSPAMRQYRFDTDTVAVVQLFAVGSLVMLALGRHKTAAASACAIVFVRGDGIVLTSMLCLIALALAAKAQPRDRRLYAMLETGAVIAPMALLYVGYNLSQFGTWRPPAASIAPFLESSWRVYEYVDTPPLKQPSELFSYVRLTTSAKHALDALLDTEFTPLPALWLALMAWPAFARPGQQWTTAGSFRLVIWLLMFPGAILIAWAGGVVFASWRTLHVLMPLAVLAGVLALGDLHAWISRRLQQIPWAIPRGLLVATVLFMSVHPFLSALERYKDVRVAAPMREWLADPLNTKLHGEPLLATASWHVMASTSSPVVQVPSNGETAIEQVAGRYALKWLLIVDDCAAGSKTVCEQLVKGKKNTLGALKVVKEQKIEHATLFRLVR